MGQARSKSVVYLSTYHTKRMVRIECGKFFEHRRACFDEYLLAPSHSVDFKKDGPFIEWLDAQRANEYQRKPMDRRNRAFFYHGNWRRVFI